MNKLREDACRYLKFVILSTVIQIGTKMIRQLGYKFKNSVTHFMLRRITHLQIINISQPHATKKCNLPLYLFKNTISTIPPRSQPTHTVIIARLNFQQIKVDNANQHGAANGAIKSYIVTRLLSHFAEVFFLRASLHIMQ